MQKRNIHKKRQAGKVIWLHVVPYNSPLLSKEVSQKESR